MKTIRVKTHAREFAEDKDMAAVIRDEELRPALERGEAVRLDFEGVTGATQSFVHALISDLIRRSGAEVLDQLEFANCSGTVQSVIEIVAEYSQYDVDGLVDT